MTKLMRLKFQKRSALKFDGRIIPEAKPSGIIVGLYAGSILQLEPKCFGASNMLAPARSCKMKKNKNQTSLFESNQIKNITLGPKSNYTDYETYIHSPEWKAKRKVAFKILGRRCKRCGKTNLLEVHHLNYNNLFNESIEDIEILCKVCHPVGDEIRATRKGYETWLRNKHGEWANLYDDDFEYEKFQNWKHKDS